MTAPLPYNEFVLDPGRIPWPNGVLCIGCLLVFYSPEDWASHDCTPRDAMIFEREP